MAFQLVPKTDLLRRDKAESGVLDLQLASQRGQAWVRGRIAGRVIPVFLAVGSDLLDVHRRWEFVEGKVTRIDDADAVAGEEPQFSIGGHGASRAVAETARTAPDSVGTVETGGLDLPLRIGCPGDQF